MLFHIHVYGIKRILICQQLQYSHGNITIFDGSQIFHATEFPYLFFKPYHKKQTKSVSKLHDFLDLETSTNRWKINEISIKYRSTIDLNSGVRNTHDFGSLFGPLGDRFGTKNRWKIDLKSMLKNTCKNISIFEASRGPPLAKGTSTNIEEIGGGARKQYLISLLY